LHYHIPSSLSTLFYFLLLLFFFFNAPPTHPIYTLSLHDALPISAVQLSRLKQLTQLMGDLGLPGSVVEIADAPHQKAVWEVRKRSEEHTSELQSRGHLVCRLLLEKKKEKNERETAKLGCGQVRLR